MQMFTERLNLREFTLADVNPSYKNWACDENVAYWFETNFKTRFDVEMWVRTKMFGYYCHDDYTWCIEIRDTQEVVGEIDIALTGGVASIGYCIGTKWTNQGYVTEACLAVIKYCFEVLNVREVVARHLCTNPASGRVLQKCGLSVKSTKKGIITYHLMKEDWRMRNGSIKQNS